MTTLVNNHTIYTLEISPLSTITRPFTEPNRTEQNSHHNRTIVPFNNLPQNNKGFVNYFFLLPSTIYPNLSFRIYILN